MQEIDAIRQFSSKGLKFISCLYEKTAPTTTFPFFPPWTLFFNAGHQGRIKIHRVFQHLLYRVFLTAPQIHDLVFWSGPDNAAEEAG
jgi:hypothetical protein